MSFLVRGKIEQTFWGAERSSKLLRHKGGDGKVLSWETNYRWELLEPTFLKKWGVQYHSVMIQDCIVSFTA